MTYPRAHLVDSINGGYYHCISRCVRQSWLCGRNQATGKSFEHRRRWIEKRIRLLSQVFAIDVYAYAVMSNHYHIVLRVDPARTADWSYEEIAKRWLSRAPRGRKLTHVAAQVERLLEQPKKIEELRKRLGSVSWFMRYINEPLARIANAEDECSGRFWEGRFKSIALLDSTAVLNCMVYVDLNPRRANKRATLPSAHTSAKARVEKKSGLAELTPLNITPTCYLKLLKWSSSQRQSPDHEIQTLLRGLSQTELEWHRRVSANSKKYRAYGFSDSIATYVASLGQRWLQIPALRMT